MTYQLIFLNEVYTYIHMYKLTLSGYAYMDVSAWFSLRFLSIK